MEDLTTARPGRPSLDRLVLGIVFAASAAMLLWMARSLFSGQIPFTGDLLHQNYPLRDFYARAIGSGLRFDWMPSLFNGFYLVGEGQLGGYHPLHWLLYRFVPLDTAFAIELVAPYPCLFAGTYLFLRRWCDAAAAAFGAMFFTFSGFSLSHGVHMNMIAIVAHVPWLLLAIHETFTAAAWPGRVRGCVAIGLLTGSQWLFGHPPAVWLSWLTIAAYMVLMLGAARPGIRRWGVVSVVCGGVLGLTIGAVQILATLDAVQHSVRATYDPSFATTFSLPPLHLLQLLEPYLLWGRVLRWNEVPGAGDEFAAYGGAVALVLAVWWLALYPWRHATRAATATDRFGLGAALFGALGLWLATGSHGRLYYVQTWLPLVGQFRAPVRFVLFTQLALATVSALAMAKLLHAMKGNHTSGPRALWAPWGVAAASACAAAALVFGGSRTVTWASEAMLAVVIGPILFATAAGLLTLAARGARWAVVGLALLAAGDQALYGLGGVVAWQDFLTRQEALGLLDTTDVPPAPNRLAHGGFPDLYTLAGYRVLDGYIGIAPARTLDYRSPQALRVAQVQYVHAEFQALANVPNATPLSRGWFRIPDPLPRARLVTDARVSRQPGLDLPSLDIDHAALTTHALALAGGPAGHASIVRDDPGSIRVSTDAPDRQLLVVSEAFDAGWTAAVDARPVPLEQVNGDFIGCVVPAGRHDVALEFRPTHLRVGKAVSLGGLGLALALAGVSRSRGKARHQ